jgi:hypothetical protein
MDFIFILQELDVQADCQYRDSIGEYSRSMRSQNLDISAISLNVHLEWMFGYGRMTAYFPKLCGILLLAWKNQITHLPYNVFQCYVHS